MHSVSDGSTKKDVFVSEEVRDRGTIQIQPPAPGEKDAVSLVHAACHTEPSE